MAINGKMDEISYGKNVEREEISGTNHGASQILATRLKERRQQRVREGEVNEAEETPACGTMEVKRGERFKVGVCGQQ